MQRERPTRHGVNIASVFVCFAVWVCRVVPPSTHTFTMANNTPISGNRSISSSTNSLLYYLYAQTVSNNGGCNWIFSCDSRRSAYLLPVVIIWVCCCRWCDDLPQHIPCDNTPLFDSWFIGISTNSLYLYDQITMVGTDGEDPRVDEVEYDHRSVCLGPLSPW